jgi:hypothetical protein
MFVGDCSGSKRLPYELSCDDLKSSLINTSLRIEEAKKEISDLSMRTGNICYFRVYQDGYYWVEVEILANDSGRVGYTYAGKSSFNTVIPYFLTTEEVARHYDDEYVKQVLRPNLAALQYYKKWCEDRIENWILKPLTPR